MLRRALACVAFLLVVCGTPAEAAGWTLNLGYQNPAVSTYGLNFLHFWTDWAFELGIGWIDVKTQAEKAEETDPDGTAGDGKRDDDSASAKLALAGDLDFKYLLTGGKFRPYLQIGMGYGIGAAAGDGGGVGANAGGVFAGLGALLGSPDLYVYAAYSLFGTKNGFVQAGVGISI